MGLFSFLFGGLFGRSYVVQKDTIEKIKREWANIDNLLRLRGPSNLRQALIAADKCLDNALKDVVAGESMGERLKNGTHLFDRDTYNKIWEAHKVRNNIVHEVDYQPPYFVTTSSIENLKKGLASLRVYL